MKLHVPANESLDKAFRQWLEWDRVAEAHGYEDEAANERAADAYKQYQVAQKAAALDAIATRLGKRIVAIGNRDGVTAVDADWLAAQGDDGDELVTCEEQYNDERYTAFERAGRGYGSGEPYMHGDQRNGY